MTTTRTQMAALPDGALHRLINFGTDAQADAAAAEIARRLDAALTGILAPQDNTKGGAA